MEVRRTGTKNLCRSAAPSALDTGLAAPRPSGRDLVSAGGAPVNNHVAADLCVGLRCFKSLLEIFGTNSVREVLTNAGHEATAISRSAPPLSSLGGSS